MKTKTKTTCKASSVTYQGVDVFVIIPPPLSCVIIVFVFNLLLLINNPIAPLPSYSLSRPLSSLYRIPPLSRRVILLLLLFSVLIPILLFAEVAVIGVFKVPKVQ